MGIEDVQSVLKEKTMGFDFVFEKDKEQNGYNLCGVKGLKDGGECDLLEIPSKHAGLPVIGIKSFFPDNTNLFPTHIKHVVLPESLGYIDPDVYISHTKIDTLTFRGWVPKYIAPLSKRWPENAKWLCSQTFPRVWIDAVIFEKGEIPPNFFRACVLKHVTIGNGVTQIGARAFEEQKIERIKIPSSVLHIGGRAFWGVPLTDVTLSEGLQSIGAQAFRWRLPIKQLSIPSTVKEIGAGAFDLSIVDRNSMKGRDWKFEVPSRYREESSDYYSTRRIYVNSELESQLSHAKYATKSLKFWLDDEYDEFLRRLHSNGSNTIDQLNRFFREYDIVCGRAPGRMFSTGYYPLHF